MEEIPVLLELPAPQSRGSNIIAHTLGGEAATLQTKLQRLDAAKLKESLGKLTGQISELFQEIQRVGDFQLASVEVSVEITAEGGVALIGQLKAGAKGAITLKFEPQPAKA